MKASSQRAWWQVHLPLMLVLGVAVTAACMAALMWWKAPVVSAKQATSSDASFVVRCDFSHRKHDDPIVFPGERGAAHSHDFFGNRSTNYASTYKSLRAAPATTCFNPADKAAYWMPTMKWGSRTLQPSYALFYYRAAHKAPKEVQPHPPGLKVVTNQNSHVTWRCLPGKWATSPPRRCSNGEQLVVRIRFPDCSNGKHDSADHRSHMAYALRQSEGTWGCPTTHKKPVPALSMNVHFPIPTASGKVRLSSGAASTIHADFFNAWDQQKLAALVRSCIKAYPFSTKNPKPARCKATGSSGGAAPKPKPKPNPEPSPQPNPQPSPELNPKPNPSRTQTRIPSRTQSRIPSQLPSRTLNHPLSPPLNHPLSPPPSRPPNLLPSLLPSLLPNPRRNRRQGPPMGAGTEQPAPRVIAG